MNNQQPQECSFSAKMRSWRKYMSFVGDPNKHIYRLGIAVIVEGVAFFLRQIAIQQIASQETMLVKLGKFILEMDRYTKVLIRIPLYVAFMLMAAAFLGRLLLAKLPGMQTEPYNIVIQTHSEEPLAPKVEGLTVKCYAEKMAGEGPQKIVVTFPWESLQGVWFEKPYQDAEHANCLCIQGKPLCQYTETIWEGNKETVRMTPARADQRMFQFGKDRVLRMEINSLHLEKTVSGIREIMESR